MSRTHSLQNGEHYEVFSKSGDPAIFNGANGFHIGSYKQFMDSLTPHFALTAFHNRAVWSNSEPPKKINWDMYVDDLIHNIEATNNQPVVGIGHSMGATVTLIAANKRPDLFRYIVLIEPPSLTRLQATLVPFIPYDVIKRVQPIKYTVNKRSDWVDRQSFFDDCRKRGVFRRFTDDALNDYVESSLRKTSESNFSLSFPKLWEAKNYISLPVITKEMRNNKVPAIAIRGKPSIFFSQKLWNNWKRSSNTVFLEDLESSHLLPLEKPEHTTKLILEGMQKVQ